MDLKGGGWSLVELLKSLMDDSGIPFSLRTRSAVGESALFVAHQSIYFDLFAALLNFGITPPPSGTPSTSMRMRLLPDFCILETKKSLVRQAAGYGNLPSKGYKNWTWGLAYGLTEVEDFSIRLLGPTGRAATGRSAGQQGFGLYGEDAEEME